MNEAILESLEKFYEIEEIKEDDEWRRLLQLPKIKIRKRVKHGYRSAKFTKDELDYIMVASLYLSQSAIAHQFGVHPSTINRIIHRHRIYEYLWPPLKLGNSPAVTSSLKKRVPLKNEDKNVHFSGE